MTLSFAPERIEQWPIARLQPYARNAKTHGADQVAKIAASMAEFGWTVPCLVAEDGELIAGHGRVLAATQLGLSELAAPVLRGDVLPERIPATGLIILRDGQPGEPEVALSPLRYHYQHRAELEVVVQAPNGRSTAFDSLIATIGTTLEADRTLGGLCDWVEPEAPASVDLPI